MKTDRRHELQTNVLADWIGKHLQQAQGYSKTILAVILLVVAAAIAGIFLARDQATRSQASWNEFFQAFGERDPEALEVVASSNPGTVASVWARLAEADLQLAEGIGDLYTNRDNAKKNLAEAERNYLAVDQAATESLLRERAWFGLGQVYESSSDLDKAKQFYDKLASSSPASALGKEAKQRSNALSDASTANWYIWFANQTPRPPAIPGMTDDFGLPNFPSDIGNISDRPDLSFPQFQPTDPMPEASSPATDSPAPGPDLNSPATESTPAPVESPEKPAATEPEQPAAPEASKAPTEPAPAEPAPAEPAPAEPAPAEPAPAEPAPAEPAPAEPAPAEPAPAEPTPNEPSAESSEAPVEGSSGSGAAVPE